MAVEHVAYAKAYLRGVASRERRIGAKAIRLHASQARRELGLDPVSYKPVDHIDALMMASDNLSANFEKMRNRLFADRGYTE